MTVEVEHFCFNEDDELEECEEESEVNKQLTRKFLERLEKVNADTPNDDCDENDLYCIAELCFKEEGGLRDADEEPVCKEIPLPWPRPKIWVEHRVK